MLHEVICRACGAKFTGGPRAWYCPDCRLERKREQDRLYKRNPSIRKLGSTDICAKCGGKYIVTGGLQKYCPDCREEAVKEIDRKQGLEYYIKNKDEINPKRNEKRRKEPDGNCVICGKPLPNTVGGRVTCSGECSKEYQKHLNKKWYAENKDTDAYKYRKKILEYKYRKYIEDDEQKRR